MDSRSPTAFDDLGLIEQSKDFGWLHRSSVKSKGERGFCRWSNIPRSPIGENDSGFNCVSLPINHLVELQGGQHSRYHDPDAVVSKKSADADPGKHEQAVVVDEGVDLWFRTTYLRPNPKFPVGNGSSWPPSASGAYLSGLNSWGALYIRSSCDIAWALAYTTDLTLVNGPVLPNNMALIIQP